MNEKSIPPPAPRGPANASPEILSKARGYARRGRGAVATQPSPTRNRANRRTSIFSPVLADSSLTRSPTVRLSLFRSVAEQDVLLLELPYRPVHDLGTDVLRLLLLCH